MNRETSHSMFNLRREYFCFRNNFLACFGPGASSIMEIFLISLTARFVSTYPVTTLFDLHFLSFQQMAATAKEAISENIFQSLCMNYYSGWSSVGWVEIVNQSEYYTLSCELCDIIYYFLLIWYESKRRFPRRDNSRSELSDKTLQQKGQEWDYQL